MGVNMVSPVLVYKSKLTGLRLYETAFIKIVRRSHFISYDSFHLYFSVLTGYIIDPCSIKFWLQQHRQNDLKNVCSGLFLSQLYC